MMKSLTKETNIKISLGLVITLIVFLISATITFVTASVNNNNFHAEISSDVDELQEETSELDKRIDNLDVKYASIEQKLDNIDETLKLIREEINR